MKSCGTAEFWCHCLWGLHGEATWSWRWSYLGKVRYLHCESEEAAPEKVSFQLSQGGDFGFCLHGCFDSGLQWGCLNSLLVFPGGSAKFDPWVGKIPWRREQLPTPVFWPGEFHEQRSLAGYSPWSWTESDTTEWLTVGMKLGPDGWG